jgi:hypothetical protein
LIEAYTEWLKQLRGLQRARDRPDVDEVFLGFSWRPAARGYFGDADLVT